MSLPELDTRTAAYLPMEVLIERDLHAGDMMGFKTPVTASLDEYPAFTSCNDAVGLVKTPIWRYGLYVDYMVAMRRLTWYGASWGRSRAMTICGAVTSSKCGSGACRWPVSVFPRGCNLGVVIPAPPSALSCRATPAVA